MKAEVTQRSRSGKTVRHTYPIGVLPVGASDTSLFYIPCSIFNILKSPITDGFGRTSLRGALSRIRYGVVAAVGSILWNVVSVLRGSI